ncbi:hypothetical protein HPP92_017156 [Vanilla planifolia]|uniref:Uncharacterized protein n=1 Tax=Vanilla planifolia TaxID=51239 RepID=A0A835UNB7_VANPL|nr:hypothetical protein HPP92_017156 [Vanilla planifolia]
MKGGDGRASIAGISLCLRSPRKQAAHRVLRCPTDTSCRTLNTQSTCLSLKLTSSTGEDAAATATAVLLPATLYRFMASLAISNGSVSPRANRKEEVVVGSHDK